MINSSNRDDFTLGCMHMGTARKIIGWIWLIGPLLLLVGHIWNSVQTDFVSLSYYAVSWGALLGLALCGFWFLVEGPGARWALGIAAVVVALYVGLMFLITSGNAPFYGGHDYLVYTVMAAGVAFCAFTMFVVGKHAT